MSGTRNGIAAWRLLPLRAARAAGLGAGPGAPPPSHWRGVRGLVVVNLLMWSLVILLARGIARVMGG